MFQILRTDSLAPNVTRFEIDAPRIARKQKPGQFVIVRVYDPGERIPLTIAGADPDRGSITLIVQAVGKTTELMCRLRAGDALLNVVGPLGRPSDIKRFGRVVVVHGGVGTAIALPVARALREAGNHVTSILGARTRDLVILEREIRASSDRTYVTTDDGSYEEHGLVTDRLRSLIENGERFDFALAVGPIPMMAAIAALTGEASIPTVVSLNPIMVDGTGMCGGCRVLVAGESRFACVDGPEFDAHDVDFDVLARRNRQYARAEQESRSRFREHAEDDLEKVRQACRLAERHPEVAASAPVRGATGSAVREER